MVAWLAGCFAPYEPDDPAPIPGNDFDDSADSGGPVATATISGAAVGCYADLVHMAVGSPATTGKVFLVDRIQGWSEEHDLEMTSQVLQLVLTPGPYPGTSIDAYVRNVSTYFSCEGHIEATGVMTYVFWVEGDCIVTGADPVELLQGDLTWVGGDPSFDLSTCRVQML